MGGIMEPVTMATMGALGGGFLFGMWYTLVRSDAKLNMRPGMSAEGLRQATGAPSFGKTKQEIDRKLAIVEARRRRAELVESKLAAQEAELRAAENSRKLAEEAEKARLRRQQERLRAEEEELLRRESEEQQRKEQEESERQRLEEEARMSKLRSEEEERLAKEQEELRQAEMAAAEEQRLAELEAAKLQEEMESRAAAEAAMSELQARLEREAEENQRQAELAAAEEQRLAELETARQEEEIAAKQAAETAMQELQERLDREGARSGDVQISLMWDNYNDLDLHVVCPSGERIHGGNKLSQCGGELDVDANVRPETKKPVENVVWDDDTAQAGEYQVYVHHYKKHKKRRTKDPTKFKVIVNNIGELLEFDGKLSHGDPIKLVAQFEVPTAEERQARIAAIRAEMDLLTAGKKGKETEEPEVEVELEDDD